jgi:hypothetical protein
LPGINPGSGGAINTGGGHSTDTNLGYSDTFSYVKGRHSIQLGFDVRFLQLNRADTSNLNGGSYNFSASDTNCNTGKTPGCATAGGSALASMILGIIDSYSLKTNLETFHYRWHYYAGFVQDDWRIAQKLTLNLGLRYNVETPRTETNDRQGTFVANIPVVNNGPNPDGAFVFSGSNGLSRHLWPINWTGIEPRIGFAYALRQSLTLRGSFGILHAPLSGLGTNIIPDLSQPDQNTSNGGGGQNPAYWTNYITNQVATVQPPTQGNSGILFSYLNGQLDYVDQRKMVPYSQVWGLSIQKGFGASSMLEIAYSGQHSVHLFSAPIDQNIPSLNTIYSAISTHANLTATNLANAYNPSPANETSLQALNPYQQFFNSPMPSAYDRLGSASYNALYVQYLQRMWKSLRIISSFTWSKSLDNFSSGATDLSNTTNVFGYSQVQNPYDLHGERSYSMYDIPFKFTNGFTYQLPFRQSKRAGLEALAYNVFVAGWSASGITNLQDGYPYAIDLGTNGYFFSVSTSGDGNALQGAQLRPNRVPGVPVKRANYRRDPFGLNAGGGLLNPAAFSVPGSLNNPQFGNVPRTMGDVRNPSSFFFDASLAKNYRFHNGQTLQFRAQGINVLNHTNFFLAGRTLLSAYVASTDTWTPSASFGDAGQTDQTPGRVIQLELRYAF